MGRHFLLYSLLVGSLLAAIAIPTLNGEGRLITPTPTILRVVDLRWMKGDPELETRLGSLQGMLNAQGGNTAIFLVRDANDAAWADILVHDYNLQKVVVSPGTLLAETRPSLKGQVLYDPAKPWTRNIALTTVALTPGEIATDKDLGLPTVLDLRTRWTNRLDAYRWAVDTYAGKTAPGEVVLAPESGHLLADLIVARKCLAIDLAPTDAEESAALQAILAKLPAGSRILGYPDIRCGNLDDALARLTVLLQGRGMALVPTRNMLNLSCFARFPAFRPLMQSRPEIALAEGHRMLLLIFDGGSAALDGSQTLEQAYRNTAGLLNDSALAGIPVGVEVPLSLLDYAPPVYQWLLSHQYFTRAEIIAAPNGNGWADPAGLAPPDAYLRAAAERARSMDMTGLSLLTVGAGDVYQQMLAQLAAGGWRGVVVRPDARANVFLPGFTAVVANGRATSKAELRSIILTDQSPFLAIYLDPNGIAPNDLQDLLPEINKRFTLLTPSQAFSALEEAASVLPWLQARKDPNDKEPPQRMRPTLKVEAPATVLKAPTAATPIPISVRISGDAPIFLARLLYQNPDGRVGTTELHNAGQGRWTALLPPTLRGGTLIVYARVVEGGGFGISISDKLMIDIPVVDTDNDGADNVLEAYQGSDPHNPDTDGDGLADGLDAQPIMPNREFIAYFMPVYPPADDSFLTDAGKSIADEQGRLIPAGGSVTYRLPLQDIPAARATLRLLADGAGTVALNSEPGTLLDTLPGEISSAELPLSKVKLDGSKLTVKITAGAQPLHILSLALISNPAGPYIRTVQLAPDFPTAGVPIPIRVMTYAPAGVKTVRVRFSTDQKTMYSLELTPVENGGGVIFGGSLPEQKDGTLLIYNVEAVDNRGNIAASSYQNVPIGLTRKYSVSFVGTRDLYGSTDSRSPIPWEPHPVWGQIGRISIKGACLDQTQVLARAGVYNSWLLAQPRERGIAFSLDKIDYMHGETPNRLSATIPAKSPDGWYLLGQFTSAEMERLYARIAPIGDKGYCAYGMLVLTQDLTFRPPLTHAGLDWYNSVTMEGIQEGQIVGKTIKVTLRATGNLGVFDVKANQRTGALVNTKDIPFKRQSDGSYVLDTRGLNPGAYAITATGYRVTTAEGMRKTDKLVSVTVKVVVTGQ